MSLGQKLMGLFIESSEAESATEAAKPSATAAPQGQPASGARPKQGTPASAAQSAPAVPPTAVLPGEADPALVEALRKTIQEHNLPGFDYFEFDVALKALEPVIPDEAIRFRSAFATAAVQGLSLDKLLQTSQVYRDLLVQERGQFEQELKAKQDADVSRRKTEIDTLGKEILAKAEQVRKLTDEIASAQKQQKELEEKAAKAASALERARSRFLASLSLVDEEIARNQTKIKTYLGGA